MPDKAVEVHFPVGGMDVARAVWDQRPRPLPQSEWDRTGEPAVVPGVGVTEQSAGVYGRTCTKGVNVRSQDATARKGGSRSGLSKLIPARAVADFIVQNLTCFTIAPKSGGTMPDGSVQN